MYKRLRSALSRITSDKFLRSAGVLAAGAIAGRAITFAFLPFVTRLYSPDDYSALAFYVGVLTIFSAVSTLRFDIAIPVPEEDRTAVSLFVLSVVSGLLVSGGLLFILLLLGDDFLSQFSPPTFKGFWFMLPLGVFFFSIYSSFQYWAARKKRFSSIALTRVSQSISGGLTSVLAGWFGFAPIGLLLGNMLNSSAGALRMLREFLSFDLPALKFPNPGELFRALKSYIRYPKFSAPEALANAAGTQLPIVVLATLAVGDDAGQLLLAMQVMLAPMALIGVSIGKVYLASGGAAWRSGTLKQLTLDVQLSLIKLGLGPIILLGVMAPAFFPFVFGDEWRKAGLFVMWMTPWIGLQFLASPVSACFHLAGQQKKALVLQLVGFFVRIGSVGIAALFFEYSQAYWFIASSAIFYLVFLLAEYKLLGVNFLDFVALIRKGWISIFLTALVVVIVLMFL